MISVVIPLYNKAHTIQRTISSVLTQYYKEFELLIVDDGSTDDGVAIIQQFTADPRVKVIRQVNQGVSAARNSGVAHARYDHIAFLDGDDEWTPNFLQKVAEAIGQFPDAGMYGSSSVHRNIMTGEGMDATLARYKSKIQAVRYFENPGVMPHTSAVVVKKAVFNQIAARGEGFPVGMKCCEDWSCFYRMAFIAPVVYIGLPLGIRNYNVSGQVTGLSKDDRFKLFKHVVDFYNLVYETSLKYENHKRDYLIFLRYDLRCRVILALRDNDYRTLDYLFENIDSRIVSLFSPAELNMYKKRQLRQLAKGYIILTKLIWRRRGYPIVGKHK